MSNWEWLEDPDILEVIVGVYYVHVLAFDRQGLFCS
jgi:hypothetical protein